MGGFVFYDTETTGIDTSFDQILQFAAIHTDADLNELDRIEMRCRIQPAVTPSPMAMYITGVEAHQLADESIPSHYEMICILRTKLLEWSPAIFLGYNSIEFDEPLLRSALYKTLHPPYLTNTNGNSRSDVMRMVQAASLFSPGIIKIPQGATGKPSFKLDLIAPANGFDHINAHDALADVEATIYMCRLISEHVPDVWSSFMRFSQKSAVLDYVSSESIFCFTEFYYGKPYSFLVTNLGQNPKNSAEVYVYNLAVDPDTLANMNSTELVRRLSEQPKPIRRLRSNACPIIMPYEDAPEFTAGKTLDSGELESRVKFLANNPKVQQRLIDAYESEKEEYEPSIYVEKQIYDGFFNSSDQFLMDKFHNVDWEIRVELVNKFEDLRLRKLGLRLIHIERPHLLSDQVRREHAMEHKSKILNADTDVPWLTMNKAVIELKGHIKEHSGSDKAFFEAHLSYIEKQIELAKLTSDQSP